MSQSLLKTVNFEPIIKELLNNHSNYFEVFNKNKEYNEDIFIEIYNFFELIATKNKNISELQKINNNNVFDFFAENKSMADFSDSDRRPQIPDRLESLVESYKTVKNLKKKKLENIPSNRTMFNIAKNNL